VRFFYLNDDVFFGAPVKLDDRFWDGGVYAAWSDEPEVEDGSLRRDADSMDNASRLSRQWLSQAFATPPPSHLPVLPVLPVLGVLPRVAPYEHTFSTFAHSPRPMRRSVLFHPEQLAPEIFAGVRSTVFRIWDKPTIVADFVIRWAPSHRLARIRAHTHTCMCGRAAAMSPASSIC